MWRNYLKERQVQVEAYMQTLAPAQSGPLSRMMESMRYSLFAGGKRLRPILLLAAADTVGGDGRQFLHSACALEMIHTYSLIHDDLPAMDDDDYRRGRLTNHKVFGDGMAVLAGDGLLTMAFETLLSQPGVTPEIRTRVALEVAQAAGPFGMVGGQAIDLDSEGQQPTPEIMMLMHRLKTGALFRASLRAGALLAGGSFTHAGTNRAGSVARWDGSTWSRVGTNTASKDVRSLAFDSQGRLLVGGAFDSGWQAANSSDTNNFSDGIVMTVYLGPKLEVLGTNSEVIVSGERISVDKGTDFEDVMPIGSSRSRTFRLMNLGTENLTISNAAFSGPGAATFAVAGMPATISYNSISNIVITFTPPSAPGV